MASKKFKKVLRNKRIDTIEHGFTENLQRFLNDNPDIKIVSVITHEIYNVTIIYQELIEVKNGKG